MKICKGCGKPGKFLMVSSFAILKNGDLKDYSYERSYCRDCMRKKARERKLKEKEAMNEVKPKPRVIKPYKDPMGPSTYQMRKDGSIKNKSRNGWIMSDDNASVAFGWAFKGLIG